MPLLDNISKLWYWGVITRFSKTENNILFDGLKYIIFIGKKLHLPLLSKSGAIS